MRQLPANKMPVAELVRVRQPKVWRLPPRPVGRLLPGGCPTAAARARRYPISRWYLRPLAGWVAEGLCPTPVRPVHLTLGGLAVGLAATAVLWLRPEMAPWAGLLVLGAWFFDRADGQLARCQGTASAWGAWLDANVDEVLDVTWHIAAASAAAHLAGSSLPWALAMAFLAGKYLFMHGLVGERAIRAERGGVGRPAPNGHEPAPNGHEPAPNGSTVVAGLPTEPLTPDGGRGWTRWLYHLPGNADVRLHLLVAGLLTGWLTAELALVAVYYNARWLLRYGLVGRRLGGAR